MQHRSAASPSISTQSVLEPQLGINSRPTSVVNQINHTDSQTTYHQHNDIQNPPILHPLSASSNPLLPAAHNRYAPITHPLSKTSQTNLPSQPALAPALTRTYAINPSSSSASANNSNVSDPRASSADSQDVNASAATRGTKDQDTGSVANPVSRPEEGGLGATEETTQSEDAMKHDPSESDKKKREKTLGYGQNKPLDAADK